MINEPVRETRTNVTKMYKTKFHRMYEMELRLKREGSTSPNNITKSFRNRKISSNIINTCVK